MRLDKLWNLNVLSELRVSKTVCLKVQDDLCCQFVNYFSLGLLNPEKGQLVLAGDPKQLGPVLRSPLAQRYGLGNWTQPCLFFTFNKGLKIE